ncbi:hypothetical protein ACJET8_002431 [Citrobacter farmeri]
MSQTVISLDDIVRLTHIHNAGQFVVEMTACRASHEPAASNQEEQLASLIFLITEQLGGVVQRCQVNWMAAEVEV